MFLGQALPRLRTSLEPIKVGKSLFAGVKSKFKKLKKLGQGAFGAAYSAIYEGKPVIVKVSLGTPGLVTVAESIETMKREVRILGMIQKFPFVPRLVEVGVDYFVQEDVEGVSLLTLLDKKGLEPREVLSTVVSAGIIASSLHREGIGHNDLEARNVLLTPHGTVLIDFGLSMSEDSDGPKAFREARERDNVTLLETLVLVLSVREIPEGVRMMIASTVEKFRKIIMAGEVDSDTAKELSQELLFALSQLGGRAARGKSIKQGTVRVVAV